MQPVCAPHTESSCVLNKQELLEKLSRERAITTVLLERLQETYEPPSEFLTTDRVQLLMEPTEIPDLPPYMHEFSVEELQTRINTTQADNQQLATLENKLKAGTLSSFPTQSFKSLYKMYVNARKAIGQMPGALHHLPLLETFLLPQVIPDTSIHFQVNANQKIGRKNEDAYFIQDANNYLAAGIFDGHNGREIAKHICIKFQEYLPNMMEAYPDNIRLGFTATFARIQAEIEHLEKGAETGSTAVLCMICKKTNMIYTATLGDSTATLYRQNEPKGVVDSIPLSCERNWGSPSEEKRAPSFAHKAWNGLHGKQRRFLGLNVSRAFGDTALRIISKKPKITAFPLNPMDKLVMCSDGLTDPLSRECITAVVSQHDSVEVLAEALVRAAMQSERYTCDDTTVIVIKLAHQFQEDAPYAL